MSRLVESLWAQIRFNIKKDFAFASKICKCKTNLCSCTLDLNIKEEVCRPKSTEVTAPQTGTQL